MSRLDQDIENLSSQLRDFNAAIQAGAYEQERLQKTFQAYETRRKNLKLPGRIVILYEYKDLMDAIRHTELSLEHTVAFIEKNRESARAVAPNLKYLRLEREKYLQELLDFGKILPFERVP